MAEETHDEAAFREQLAALRRQAMEKELVLSRVRDEIRKMRDAEDFEQVLVAMRASFDMLQVPYFECGINVVEERGDTVVVRRHNMDRQGQWSSVEQATGRSIIADFWRSGEPVYRTDLDVEDPYREKRSIDQTYGGEVRSGPRHSRPSAASRVDQAVPSEKSKLPS